MANDVVKSAGPANDSMSSSSIEMWEQKVAGPFVKRPQKTRVAALASAALAYAKRVKEKRENEEESVPNEASKPTGP